MNFSFNQPHSDGSFLYSGWIAQMFIPVFVIEELGGRLLIGFFSHVADTRPATRRISSACLQGLATFLKNAIDF